MDAYTLILFLGLTVVGGLIAFMGDRLGRYMGKRRMTIFGLRPRHTALLFTVVAGMLIAVTSLVTLSLLNANVYRAVFQVGRLVRDRTHLTEQNEFLRREKTRLQATYDRSLQRAREARDEEARSRAQLQETLARLEETRREAQQRVTELRTEVARKSRVAAEKSKQIDTLGKRLAAAQQELQSVAKRLEGTRERYQQAESRYRQAKTRYEEVAARHETVRGELESAREALELTRVELQAAETQRDALQQTVRASQEQIRTLREAKLGLEESQRQLMASREALRSDISRLQADTQRLEGERRRLEGEKKALLDTEVIFARSEELAWEVIDGREPQSRIREHLIALVERARAIAAARGAGPADDPRQALVAVKQADPSRYLTDAQAIDLAAEEISHANTGVVAQVIALRNTVPGQEVIGYINTWTNRLVFHEGERIAGKQVERGQSTGQIVAELATLLQSEVRAEAVKRGMIPRSGVPGSAASLQVGEMPLADLVAAAEQARKHRYGAQVEVLAAGDLWTADSMKVTFRVTPLPAPTPTRPGGSVLTAQ